MRFVSLCCILFIIQNSYVWPQELYSHLAPESSLKINPKLKGISKYLESNSKYVSKEFLHLLIEAPELLEDITGLEIPPNDIIFQKENLSAYIAEKLQEIKRHVTTSTEYKKARGIKKKNSLIYNAQVNFLANYRRLCLVKIALIMGKGQEALQDINKAGYNMSVALLEGAYITAEYLVSRELGKPSSEFAILLTGSSSRNEFPFSDYDALGIYEKSGKTSKGKRNKQYFDTLYQEIGGVIDNIGCSFDFSVSPLNKETGDLAEYLSKLEVKRQFASGLYPLAYGVASNTEWGADMLIHFNNFFYSREKFRSLLAQLAFVRENRAELHSEYYHRNNIKYFRGGLADGFDIYRIYKLVKGLIDNDIFSVLVKIEKENKDLKGLAEIFKFLTWIKIRLDLHYGENKKFLPKDRELEFFSKSIGYRSARDFLRDLVQKMELFNRLTSQAIQSLVGNHDWEALVREGSRLEQGAEMGTTVLIDRDEMAPEIGEALDFLRARMSIGGGGTAYRSPRDFSGYLSPKEEAEKTKDDLADYLRRTFGIEVSVKIDSPKKVILPKVSWKSPAVKTALARSKELNETDAEVIEKLREKTRGGLLHKRKSLDPLSVILRTKEGDVLIRDDDDIILDHKIAQERIPESVKSWIIEFDGTLEDLGLNTGEEEIIYRYRTPIGVQEISNNWQILLEIMKLTDTVVEPSTLTGERPIERSL